MLTVHDTSAEDSCSSTSLTSLQEIFTPMNKFVFLKLEFGDFVNRLWLNNQRSQNHPQKNEPFLIATETSSQQ